MTLLKSEDFVGDNLVLHSVPVAKNPIAPIESFGRRLDLERGERWFVARGTVNGEPLSCSA